MNYTTNWDPQAYAKNARFVADLGQPLLELLAPQPGELIMDLGCGDGALTEKIVARGASVLGTDASIAQARAAKDRHLLAAVVDGHHLCLKPKFDAVFSNAALHWMKQPERVVQGVWQCLKTGSRFVAEFGGKGNIQTIRSALHGALRRRGIDPITIDPWYYPSPEDFSKLLVNSRFIVRYIEIIPRPTHFPESFSIGWKYSPNPSPTQSKRVVDSPFLMRYAGEVNRPCAMPTGDGRWITSD